MALGEINLVHLCVILIILFIHAAHSLPHSANIVQYPAAQLATRQQSSTITYQVHSYNDLREWPQILRKGAVYFKIDPHYMTSSFCASQPQTPPATNPLGCFVLSHDTPVSTRQYNTTLSVLNFITDPQYASYYANPAKKIHIALCFKLDSASPCDGSITAQNWTALTDSFFEMANSVVTNKGLNVEFILDGSSTPTDSNLCLINKWRPWVATWIPGDSEGAPFSNNATFGYDRFQVFNPSQFPGIPGYYIDIWQIQDYGKFSKGNYSYLFWEPSDQSPILDVSDSYLFGPLHQLGFRFAINIDPIQLQVFSGSRSGNAWNYNVVSSSTATSPAVVVLPSASSPSTYYIITSFYDTKSNTQSYAISTAPTWNSTQLGPITAQTTNVFPNSSTLPILGLSSIGTSTIFASLPNGTFSVYSFGESNLEFKLSAIGQLTSCTDCKSSVFLFEDTLYAVQIVNGGDGCALQLQMWNLTDFSHPIALASPFCVQKEGTLAGYSAAFSAASQTQSFCTSGYLPGVVVYADNSQSIFTSVLCADPVTGNISANGGSVSGTGIAVDVGSYPSVSLFAHNGELLVLEVHSDGFCWNSEPNNKQPSPATCSNTPISVPYVLNYNYGSFDDWALHLTNVINNLNTSYNLDSIFSSCHPTILHGVYDSGSYPQATMFSAMDKFNNEVLLLAEVHLGLPQKYSNASQCGFAVPMEGLVLDSWLINEW